MRITTDNPKVNYTIDFYSFNIISADKEVRSKYYDVPMEIYDGFIYDFNYLVDNMPIEMPERDSGGNFVLDSRKYFTEERPYKFALIRSIIGRDDSTMSVKEFNDYIDLMKNLIE